MPAEKEQNHFATDLLPATDPYRDRGRYLKLFATARAEKRVGEASVFHLYSVEAAENIHAFNADAKIEECVLPMMSEETMGSVL